MMRLCHAILEFIFREPNVLHHFPITECQSSDCELSSYIRPQTEESAIFTFALYILSGLADFLVGKECNGVDHQLPFSTCVGTLRIRVNTKCIFKMPFMMILLWYRVSLSDGNTKIDTE